MQYHAWRWPHATLDVVDDAVEVAGHAMRIFPERLRPGADQWPRRHAGPHGRMNYIIEVPLKLLDVMLCVYF